MINIKLKDIEMQFETEATVFSPSNADKGTLAMLSQVEFSKEDKVLDLGCGYGLVGIFAAKLIGADRVYMSDINKTSLDLAKVNIELNDTSGIKLYESNGFKGIDEKDFTLILSNPPYHVDFSVPKEFIEKGFNRLVLGGKLVMVTKRKDWYKNKIIAIFGGVRIIEIEGYYVFIGEKRSGVYASKKV
ncbi:MAG TPA: methyltransferase [Clostridiaceae bacterium]